MTYKNWFQVHGEKHKAIMDKLTHLSDDEIIAYFRFENMVICEPDFCLLYKDNKKCHDIEELNCYLCACPYFRFDDEGLEQRKKKTLYSTCSIESKDGSQFITEESIHQDCTGCVVPHHESYIQKNFQKNFSRDWFTIMKDVQA